jgi:RNA polymerase sigma factor (sigma-70 family)
MLRPMQRRVCSGLRKATPAAATDHHQPVSPRGTRLQNVIDLVESDSHQPVADGADASGTGLRHSLGYVPHRSFFANGADCRYGEFKTQRIDKSEPFDSFSPDHSEAAFSAPSHRDPVLQEAFLQLNYRRWKIAQLVESAGRTFTDAELKRLCVLEREVCEIRNWIIETNEPLLLAISSRFLQPGVTLDELQSEASTILLRAINQFDVRRGVLFSTYASTAIRRHLHRWLGSQTRLKARQGSLQELNFEPVSLQIPSATMDLKQEETLRDAIQSLPRVWQQIVKLRFGLSNRGRPLSFRVISERLGMNRERCRRLCGKALSRLRTHPALRHFEPSGEWGLWPRACGQ